MKKILAIIFIITISFASNAQKHAHIDSEYILGKIPAYKEAQKKLNDISKKWKKEIEDKYNEIKTLYSAYQKESALMSNEMKLKKENEIIDKEKEAQKLQKKYFGQQGDMHKKRQELIKPIQDEIDNAVKQIAEEGNYAYIHDISSDQGIIYANKKFDISDDILKKMGY